MVQSQGNLEKQGHFVEANGLHIYYEEYGDGIPLLLIHGGTGTGRSDWEAIIPALTPHFHVFAPDRRGHGQTDNPAGQMSYRMMADDLAGFIQVLGMDRPWVSGHSDGGQVSLELAMRYPGLAWGFVISGATYIKSDHWFKAIEPFGFDRSGLNITFFTEKFPEWAEFIKRTHHPEDPDYWKTLLQEYGVMYNAPLNYSKEDLQKIVDPTLILSGDRDEFVPLEDTVGLYQRIQHAELAVIPNISHNQTVRNDGPYIPIILDFFKRHSSGSSS